MKSVLVTGATGFIGSHLAYRLAESGAHVVGTGTSEAGGRLQASDRLTPAVLDLRDTDSIGRLFAQHRFSTVFHLAAQGVQAAEATPSIAEVNTLGTFRLAQAALRHGIDRFVYCGSALEYKPGSGPMDESTPVGGSTLYGATKAAGWLLLDHLWRAEGLPLVTMRPFAVFGPGESPLKLIPYVISRALRREPIELTHGRQVRDYIYVSDVIDALMVAPQAGAGAVFNIGGGVRGAQTVRAIVRKILELMNAPESLCRFGAARRSVPECSLISEPSLAERVLGWKPAIPLIEGLTQTIAAAGCTQNEI